MVITPRVLIQHEVKYNSKGDAAGLRYKKVGQVVLNAEWFYIHKDADGNDVCRVSCGDTWSVKRVNHPNYEYMTVQ